MVNRASALFFLTILTASPHTAFGQQCNTGTLVCCQWIDTASSPSAPTVGQFAAVGVPLVPAMGLVGCNCSPITGSDSCPTNPLRCREIRSGGAVAFSCCLFGT
ncbi:hypothetical protein BD779DRAFT_1580696 [Infundibulicybe gibba]|nr:hypothetical protein BD779DRAFT_1580696 [Infundibulicybe gibba]